MRMNLPLQQWKSSQKKSFSAVKNESNVSKIPVKYLTGFFIESLFFNAFRQSSESKIRVKSLTGFTVKPRNGTLFLKVNFSTEIKKMPILSPIKEAKQAEPIVFQWSQEKKDL